MSDDTLSQRMWGQYATGLASELGAGTSDAAVQILPAAQLVQGSDPTQPQTPLSVFANQVPQWGSSYAPSSGTVLQAYQVVLTQMKETATNGASIEQKYEAANKKLATMMGNASDYKLQKIKSWQATCATYNEAGLQPPSFQDWFKDNGLQAYTSLLDDQTHQVEEVQTLLEAASITSPLVENLSALNKQIAASKTDAAPPITFNPGASLLVDWQSSPTNPGGFTFDQTTKVYDYSKTVWNKQSGVSGLGFVAIGARKTGTTQQNVMEGTTSYHVGIEYDARATFSMVRGDWFNLSLLKDYKNGPWMPGSQFATGNASPWGEGGILPLVATEVFVVLNPRILLTISTSSIETVYKQLQDKMTNGISVGPFAFGGSGSSKDSTLCTSNALSAEQTITIRDTSNIPQIVAVIDQVVP